MIQLYVDLKLFDFLVFTLIHTPSGGGLRVRMIKKRTRQGWGKSPGKGRK